MASSDICFVDVGVGKVGRERAARFLGGELCALSLVVERVRERLPIDTLTERLTGGVAHSLSRCPPPLGNGVRGDPGSISRVRPQGSCSAPQIAHRIFRVSESQRVVQTQGAACG
jgi:hypothetical protein